jgi:hypothetical protein
VAVALRASTPGRVVLVGVAPRTLFTGAVLSAPSPAPPATLARAAAAPLGAAELRALSVRGVVGLVESLGVSPAQAEKLAAQEVDGAALLETSLDELRSYGLSGGAAHASMRGIAPAVAEVQVAAAQAQSVTLTIFPPTDKKKNNPYKMTLTPDLFQRTFSPAQTPLRLVNSSGSFVRIVTSLAEAAVAGQKATNDSTGSGLGLCVRVASPFTLYASS